MCKSIEYNLLTYKIFTNNCLLEARYKNKFKKII